MPGNNHDKTKGDKGSSYTNCVFVSSYYIAIIFTVTLEASILARYFLFIDMAWATSFACYSFLLFAIIVDVPVFWSLTRTKHEDPGYLFPTPNSKDESQLIDNSAVNEHSASNVCKKCGVRRKNEQTHHCSRCGHCVDLMDHHCTVTNNCVGRKNMRFFIQFTAWASFGLMVLASVLIILCYTQNIERGVGA